MRLQGNIVSSANGDVAASIEQLRRTVRELAAKVASRQARTPDETPPQQTVQTPPHSGAARCHHQAGSAAVRATTGVLGTELPESFVLANLALKDSRR